MFGHLQKVWAFWIALLLPWSVMQAAPLKVGVTAGPHAAILQDLKTRLAPADLELEIVEFNDFILPNEALAQGDLDLNCYQHLPFLEDQIQRRGYPLQAVGKTILLPLALYGGQVKALDQLPEGAKVAIPNDPTNGSRALLLLQKQGLLQLDEKAGILPSVLDIRANPKKLEIIELEAPQLPRSLPDVALAVINTDWALVGGLDLEKDVLAWEAAENSPYANILVAHKDRLKDPRIETFVKLYQTPETAAFIHKTFKNAVLAAW